ncbi:MAG: aminopeptidase P N-terminal domain-containing protein [Planctomycetota bacterium]|nr:aminopeptidase P N-terminal domain-containing protein [Planctomycetota bacterium]
MSRDALPDPSLHRARRQRLLNTLGDGVLILSTAPETRRNGDVHNEYRPGSDMLYLTGFPEPAAVLVAWRLDRRRHKAILFVRPKDRTREIWDGRRYGTRDCKRRFGVDEARSIEDLWTDLPDLLSNDGKVLHTFGVDEGFDARLFSVFRVLSARRRKSRAPAHPVLMDPSPALAAQRLVKDAAELAAMRRAAEVTCAGHVAAMTGTRPGMYEYQAQALLEAAFRDAGSPRNGYPSIVASGANACVLHYHENDRKMRSGDLLLIDAGAEVDGMTGDVTRTFPVDGAFTATQRAVYAVVLRAQLAGIRACKAGAPWDAPHRACVRSLTRGLVELGVLRGDPATLVKSGAFRPYYMHGTSHWLGRDVHDVGGYEDERGRPAPMPAGAVLTVEPGLYFARDDKSVQKELRGIGVRIEDDILVTKRRPEVLTAAAPKSIRDVEALMRGAR